MSLESTLKDVLGQLVDGRATPDVVAENSKFPCITYQQVGGKAGWYAEQQLPSHLHARVQVNVWAKTRAEANELARQAEAAICTSASLKASESIGALVAEYQEQLALYGTRQDFGVWFPRS